MEKRVRLTWLQKGFVMEFPKDLNGTKAVIRAGYSERSAAVQASRLLRNAKVQVALQKAMQDRAARTEITQDRVLREIARIAFSSIGEFTEWSEAGMRTIDSDKLSEDQLAAISEVTAAVTRRGYQVRVKLHDKLKALELAARHLGLEAAAVQVYNDNRQQTLVFKVEYDDDGAPRALEAAAHEATGDGAAPSEAEDRSGG